MHGKVLRLALILCAAFVWTGCARFTGCDGMISESPPIHLNPNMDQQTRIDPQEPSKFFKDKRGARKLVAGTVARPLRISRKDRDSRFLRANDHLYRGYKTVMEKNPATGKMEPHKRFYETLPAELSLSMALLERGRERFNIYCAACHGYGGNGRGIVRLYDDKFTIKSLHSDRSRGLAVGEIYNVIVNGSGRMNALRSAIPVKDRWAIVAYVRALQLARIHTSSR